MKSVYLCATPRHLIMTLLHSQSANRQATIVLTAYSEALWNFFNSLRGKLATWEGVSEVHVLRRRRAADYTFLARWLDRRFIRDHLGSYRLVNFLWLPQSLVFASQYFFAAADSAVFLEDAPTMSNALPEQGLRRALRKLVLGIDHEFWTSPKLSEIWVSNPDAFPNFPREKMRRLTVDLATISLDQAAVDRLLTLFGVTIHNFLGRRPGAPAVLVLAQPISSSVGRAITRSSQRRIFSALAQHYHDLGYTVLFKRHPRDDLDYELEPSIATLPRFLPSEMLRFLPLNLDTAVSLASSGILGTGAVRSINADPAFPSHRNLSRTLEAIRALR
ncbi:MAG: hypothetical protein LBD77_03480 [Bifidobacteriaceae bacterium]|jgi:hypothetical protein|nr:hypothetical protein [Bifidobacteriaceae bacterium]